MPSGFLYCDYCSIYGFMMQDATLSGTFVLNSCPALVAASFIHMMDSSVVFFRFASCSRLHFNCLGNCSYIIESQSDLTIRDHFRSYAHGVAIYQNYGHLRLTLSVYDVLFTVLQNFNFMSISDVQFFNHSSLFESVSSTLEVSFSEVYFLYWESSDSELIADSSVLLVDSMSSVSSSYTLNRSVMIFQIFSHFSGEHYFSNGKFLLRSPCSFESSYLSLNNCTLTFSDKVNFPSHFKFQDLLGQSSIVFSDFSFLFASKEIVFDSKCYFHSSLFLIDTIIIFFSDVFVYDSISLVNSTINFYSNVYFYQSSSFTADLLSNVYSSSGTVYIDGYWNLSRLRHGSYVFSQMSILSIHNIQTFDCNITFDGTYFNTTSLLVSAYSSRILFTKSILPTMLELTIIESSISFVNVSDLELQTVVCLNSTFELLNFEIPARFQNVINTSNCLLYFNSGFPIIIPQLDQSSTTISGSDAVIILANIQISIIYEFESCCPTKYCSFVLKEVSFDQQLIQFSLQTFNGNLDRFSHSNDSLLVESYDNFGYSLRVSIFEEISNTFITNVLVSVCAPTFDFISKPKPMGDVLAIIGSNFGSRCIQFIVETLNYSINVLPLNHSTLSFEMVPYDGCHDFSVGFVEILPIQSHFCYQPPTISSFEPLTIPLSGYLKILGSNFGEFRVDLQFVNAATTYEFNTISNNLLIIQLFSICSDINRVNFTLSSGGQSTSEYQLFLRPPVISTFPSFISKTHGYVYLESPYLSYLSRSNCLPFFSINYVLSLNYTTVGRDYLAVYVPLVEDDHVFTFTLSFFDDFDSSIDVSIPVTRVEALPLDWICFVKANCTVILQSTAENFNFYDYSINHGLNLTVVDFILLSKSKAQLTFVHVNSGEVPEVFFTHNDLDIQFQVANMPILSQILSIWPSTFQFFDYPTVIRVEISCIKCDLFTKHQWKNTLLVGEFSFSTIEDLKTDSVVGIVEIPAPGLFYIQTLNYQSLIITNWTISCQSFVSYPLIVPFSAYFSVTLSLYLSDLHLLVDGIIINLAKGSQSLINHHSNAITLFNNLNCISLNVSFLLLKIDLPQSISISFLSKCHDTHANLPFDILLPPGVISHKSCSSFPSGFLSASKCDVEFVRNSVVVNELHLTFVTELQLVEFEIFGYSEFQCFIPVNESFGENAFGQTLEFSPLFVYNTNVYSDLNNLIVDASSDFTQRLTVFEVNFQIVDYTCINSLIHYALTFIASDVFSIKCDGLSLTYVDVQSTITFDCSCRDYLGFPTSCDILNTADVIIESKLIDAHIFSCHNFSCLFNVSTIPQFPFIHEFSIFVKPHSNQISYFNLTLINQIERYLLVDLVSFSLCEPLIQFKTCLECNLSIALYSSLPLTSSSIILTTKDVVFVTDTSQRLSVVNDSVIQIYTFPSTSSQSILIEYQSSSFKLELPVVHCSSFMENRDGYCDCPPGHVFQFGDCSVCPINYFKSVIMLDCARCPLNRVTLNNVSSSTSDCVCYQHLYEKNSSCVDCPFKTKCQYGAISTVQSGYYFDVTDHVTLRCNFPYLCQNNSCVSSGFNGIFDLCRSCRPNFKRIFTLCLEISVLNYVVSLLINVLFVCSIFGYFRHFRKVQKVDDQLTIRYLKKRCPLFSTELSVQSVFHLVNFPTLCPFY
ncbi:hypothetical protein GEMRC1_005982 [Eukaryota sp. GEM-RC1]